MVYFLDVRKGQCFMTFNQTCSFPRFLLATRELCCCSKGAGWGSNETDCAACPSSTDGNNNFLPSKC